MIAGLPGQPNDVATGIIVPSEVAIVPAGEAAKLLHDVEYLFALWPTKIQLSISDIVALPGVYFPVPAGAQWPGKRSLFRRRLFLVH